jgi:phosphohistidine phosphatase SixA
MSKRSPVLLGATGAGVKPGDYSLSSPQSRAAARAMLLARRFAERKREELVVTHYALSPDKMRVGEWNEAGDGTLIRVSHLPRE